MSLLLAAFRVFVMLEITLQLVIAFGPSALVTLSRKMLLTPWEFGFLDAFERNGPPPPSSFYRVGEPTLGWVHQPRGVTDGFSTPFHATTNDLGYRSTRDFRVDKDKFRILLIGDSFTFGEDVSDGDTWAERLEARTPEAQVFNFGVSGYGTDQMLLTLMRAIERIHPQLVLVGYVTDDLYRALLYFRDYAKPRFVLEDGELRLRNVPIAPPDELAKNLRRYVSSGVFPLKTSSVWRILRRYFEERFQSCPTARFPRWREREALTLNLKIFRRMWEVAHDHGAYFSVIYLQSRALRDSLVPDEGGMFLKEISRENSEISVFDTEPFFRKYLGNTYRGGHYRRNEARQVGDWISEFVRGLRPYREWRAVARQAAVR